MRILLGLALAGLLFAYRSLGAAELDGSIWELKVRPKSLFAFSRKDTLVFERGRLSSSRFLSSGFLPGGYRLEKAPEDAARFEASLESGDGDQLDWRGEIRGDRMRGTLFLKSADGRISAYSFRGRRR